jgi:subtilisin-like proprotein convertase family protein
VTGGYGTPIAAFRLTKLDTSGNITWQQPMVNTTGGSYAGGIAADSDGLLYVGGSFTAPMAIDTGDRVVNLTPDPASTLSNGDIYVLKYNPNLARISGVVYGDLNDDGAREAEPGTRNWTVSLTDSTGAVVQTTTTDLDGNYAFRGPAPGTYTVSVSAPDGWQPTNPTGGSQAVTVSSGQYVSQYFGFYTPNAALTKTNSTSQSITSGSTASSTLNVTDAKTILDLNVQLNISYPVDSDLSVALVAPDGTKVTLFANVGSGMNFTNTVLDSEASTSIASGASPFTGTFRPTGDLAAFYGKSTQGVWTLQVTEANTKRRGTLNSWSLNFIVPTTAGMTSAAVRSAPGSGRPAVVASPTGPTAVAQAPIPLTVAPPSPGTQGSPPLISLTPPSDQDLTLLAADLIQSGTKRSRSASHPVSWLDDQRFS